MIDLPTLLEDIDSAKFITNPYEKEVVQGELVAHCWLFDRRLAEWYLSLPPTAEHELLGPNKRNFFTVEDLSAAHLLTFFWSICLILYITIPNVLGLETPLPEHATPQVYCRKIIQTIPVFLYSEVGMYRVHLATFPMGVALRYLTSIGPDEMPEERTLLAGYLRTPEAATMRRFLSNMQLAALESNSVDINPPKYVLRHG